MIPLMRSTFIHERETLAALSSWLATAPPRLSMGWWCETFEHSFAAWQGRKHAALFNSGASANLALIQSLQNLGRLPYGSLVGFSALTWATNVMPLMQLGCETRAIDVDPRTLNVTSDTLADHLRDLDALFITNALGYLPDLDRIRDLCNQGNVLLIEDNCESLGSELPSGKAGNFGLASTFSFFVAHHMSTIEGGMVCTDDPELAEMLVMVRANGWDRNLDSERQDYWRNQAGVSDFQAAYTFYVPAYNLRPTEITGFLGIVQMRYLDENITRRMVHFANLEPIASANPDFQPLSCSHMARLSPFCFPVVCNTPELRDKYVSKFKQAGVEIRPIIAGNIARQPFYNKLHLSLPGADKLETCGFYHGLYPELTDSDIAILQECLSYA